MSKLVERRWQGQVSDLGGNRDCEEMMVGEKQQLCGRTPHALIYRIFTHAARNIWTQPVLLFSPAMSFLSLVSIIFLTVLGTCMMQRLDEILSKQSGVSQWTLGVTTA